MKMTYAPTVFAEAARSLGYHPFPSPSANLSAAYTNPLGIKRGQCTYCGFCERFGCANYSKSSPQTAVLPVLMRKSNFEARTECEVTKINLDAAGKRATGVTYVDSAGAEWEQPADIVLVCAFAFNNVRMLLISGIGQPYDPGTRQGTVGRNYAYQTNSGGTQLFFDDKIFNPFIASGALGQTRPTISTADGFDQRGGLGLSAAPAHQLHPDQWPPDPDPAGATRHAALGRQVEAQANCRAYSRSPSRRQGSYSAGGNHLDLDPTYKDRYLPLLLMTRFSGYDIHVENHVTDKG